MANGLLDPILSRLWSGANARARKRARSPSSRAIRLPTRVISVGNLQVGGAGKTPLVAELLRQAVSMGRSAWVLTRGYRSEWEKSGGVIRPGEDPRPSQCGDEAALLAWRSTEHWIGVGRDRAQSYARIREEVGKDPDCVILDDGFQHHALARDLDILAVTDRKFEEGLFRDRPEVLRDTHALVVWTKGEVWPWQAIRPYDVRVRFALQDPAPDHPPLWLVTGVADSSQVKKSLAECGYRIIRHLAFGDHEPYSRRLMDRILREADDARARVALTGKDWVKWRAEGISPRDVDILEPSVEFLEGKEKWFQKVWGHS